LPVRLVPITLAGAEIRIRVVFVVIDDHYPSNTKTFYFFQIQGTAAPLGASTCTSYA
jgi:hypothetical protein